MVNRYIHTSALVLVGLALTASPSLAQRRNDGGGRRDGGSARTEQAAPRSSDRNPDRQSNRVPDRQYSNRAPDRQYSNRIPDRQYSGPRNVRPSVIVPYRRPYSYGYRTYASPFGYRSYAYRPGFSLYFGLPYSGYGYPAYGGGYGYYGAVPGRVYGSVRIVDSPRDAQVFVDGYYAGVVDDYDGVFQRLNLEIGPHHLEIEAPGYPRVAFDVRIEPGQTVTYHAYGRP